MPMKRLFQLTLANGKTYESRYARGQKKSSPHIMYFDEKPMAKLQRDQINMDESFPDKLKPVKVSPGPDHWRYKG